MQIEQAINIAGGVNLARIIFDVADAEIFVHSRESPRKGFTHDASIPVGKTLGKHSCAILVMHSPHIYRSFTRSAPTCFSLRKPGYLLRSQSWLSYNGGTT